MALDKVSPFAEAAKGLPLPAMNKKGKAKATTTESAYSFEKLSLHSNYLERTVQLEVFKPAAPAMGSGYPLLLLNDGQDSLAVGLFDTLENLVTAGHIHATLAVGVVAGDRMAEYGTAFRHDHQRRGARAYLYSKFVALELIPFLRKQYHLTEHAEHNAIAGYSLGGLSAVDIAWNHPQIFGRVGAFSGSFWWRRYTLRERLLGHDAGRLMHLQIRRARNKPKLKFWFQAGTHDELEDRNNNGVIDAIDDTLDLMVDLTRKGYRPFHDFTYHEMQGGEHNPATWKLAMPHFLQWAFGKK